MKKTLYSTPQKHGTGACKVWRKYSNALQCENEKYTVNKGELFKISKIHKKSNIQSISKNIQQPILHGTRKCKILRKYSSNACSSYSAKTKREGQTGGRVAFQYLPSRAFGVAGYNNT